MASTPVEPDLGPHTGDSQSEPAFIVPQFRDPDGAQPDGAQPDGTRVDTPRVDGTGEASVEVDPPRRRRLPVVGLLIVLALAAIVVLASVSFSRFVDPPAREVRATGGPAAPPGPGYTVSGPLGSTQAAEFQLVAGVTAVVVRTADLGTALYRASTPNGSGFVPRVAQEGDQVRLRVVNAVDNGSTDTVTMELNQRVKWRINMIGGSESATVDLRSASIAGVDFTGGVARIELWLPPPQGEVTVRMSGGARDFLVYAPTSVPVRVVLARGAASVTVDGSTRSGVAAGTRLVPTGWNAARDRYVVDAVAGLGSLTVRRQPPDPPAGTAIAGGRG